ncbi:hypothetical protein PDA01_07700 [Pediococcus damnosus]|nr:hypothetical protein PDA01_07700 [Pediococcus damnosus]
MKKGHNIAVVACTSRLLLEIAKISIYLKHYSPIVQHLRCRVETYQPYYDIIQVSAIKFCDANLNTRKIGTQ